MKSYGCCDKYTVNLKQCYKDLMAICLIYNWTKMKGGSRAYWELPRKESTTSKKSKRLKKKKKPHENAHIS